MSRRLSILAGAILIVGFIIGPASFATDFDFHLLELEIAATPPLVFFDDFEDGVKNPALIEVWGSTTESGGVLHFTDTDGCLMRPNGNCDDLLFFALSFLDGAGDVEITATLAPVTPSANPQTFALILDQDPSIEPVFGIWRRVNPDLISSPCGVGLQALVGLLPQDGSGDPAEVLGCDAIDPAAVTGNIVLKFIVDDQSNEIHSLYSIDGGANFIDSLSFDAPTGPITGFPIELTYDFALVALGGPHPPDADKDTKDTKDSKDSKDTKDADKDSKNK